MERLLVPPLLLLCSAGLALHHHLPVAAASLPSPTAPSHQSGKIVLARRPSNMIFHPSTGSCVLRKSLRDPLTLGPCLQSDAWAYTPQKFLVVKGTYFCLQAVGSGEPAKLSIICSESDSQWNLGLRSTTAISTNQSEGGALCLDVDGETATLVTNPCSSSDSQLFEFTAQNSVTTPASSSLP